MVWKADIILMYMAAKIYKITNDINSKIYVGQTHKTIEKRFLRHCQESRWRNIKKMPIVFAIKKYGKEHFKIHLLETLPENSSQQLIDERERDWGLKLNCLSPKGYNLKLGNGRGKLSEETKKKISHSNKGKIVSLETRKKSSDAHKGYIMPLETRKKISNFFKNKVPHKNTQIGASKKNSKTYILQSPSGEITTISNMKKFCEQNELCRSSMSRLCTEKIFSYRGWKLIKNKGFNK